MARESSRRRKLRIVIGLRPTRLPRLLAIAIAVVAGGCGGGSSDSATPAELAGTYTATLEQSDFPPNAPPELVAGRWTLSIGELEGPDAGTFLALKGPENQVLEEPGLEVDDDVLTLTNEECAQDVGYAFYDNEYSWELDGSTLTLGTVKNDCADRVAETLLTSRPWTKQQ
jgi:hypothetical protein